MHQTMFSFAPIVLSSSIKNYLGTTNSDLFFAAANTSIDGMSLGGGDGYDYLTVAVNNTAALNVKPVLLKSIESLFINASASRAAFTLNAASAADLAEITVATASTLPVTVQNVSPSLKYLTLQNFRGDVNLTGTVGSPLTVTFAGATVMSWKYPTIDFSGMSAGLALNFGGVDASTSARVVGTSGDDTFNFKGFGSNIQLEGGAGRDTLVMSAQTLHGFQGWVQVSNVEALSVWDAARQGDKLNVGNFNLYRLVLNAASSAEYEVSFNGEIGTQVAGTSGWVFTSLDNTLELLANNTGNVKVHVGSFHLPGVLTLISGSNAANCLSHGKFTIDGTHVVNLVSNGNLGVTNIAGISMATSKATDVLNISGARGVEVGAVTADVIDASSLGGSLKMTSASSSATAPALSGAYIINGQLVEEYPIYRSSDVGVKITGSAFNDTLWGSTGKDIINGGAGNDVIRVNGMATQGDILTGGTGSDKFRFEAATRGDLLKLSAGTSQVVTVTDFNKSEGDKIVLAGGFSGISISDRQTITKSKPMASLDDVYKNISAIEATSLKAIGPKMYGYIASAKMVTVEDGAAKGSYLYVNDEVAAVNSSNDMLIKITVVGGGALSRADFDFA